MDSKQRPENVPFIVFETELDRLERHNKRLWIALLSAIVSIVLIVAGFLWYLNQYDFASYDYEQDGQGVNIIGNRNGVDYDVPALQGENANEEE